MSPVGFFEDEAGAAEGANWFLLVLRSAFSGMQG